MERPPRWKPQRWPSWQILMRSSPRAADTHLVAVLQTLRRIQHERFGPGQTVADHDAVLPGAGGRDCLETRGAVDDLEDVRPPVAGHYGPLRDEHHRLGGCGRIR